MYCTWCLFVWFPFSYIYIWTMWLVHFDRSCVYLEFSICPQMIFKAQAAFPTMWVILCTADMLGHHHHYIGTVIINFWFTKHSRCARRFCSSHQIVSRLWLLSHRSATSTKTSQRVIRFVREYPTQGGGFWFDHTAAQQLFVSQSAALAET